MKITKEFRRDLTHLFENFKILSSKQIGQFMVAVMVREKKKLKNHERKVKC